MLTIKNVLQGSEWKRVFSKSALLRGREYFHEQRVELLQIDDQHVHASCRGSAGNVYEQLIRLEYNLADAPFLECMCTCPVTFHCKHCAAVLLYVCDSQLSDQEQGLSEHMSPFLERWLDNIPAGNSAANTVKQSNASYLLYLLALNRKTGKWQVDFYKARLLKDGSLRDLQRYTFTHTTLQHSPGYLLDSDLKFARLLVASFAHTDFVTGFELKGQVGAELLELLLATSRLFLDFDSPQPLVTAAPRPVDFSWAEQPNGYYRGQWLSSGQSLDAVLALEPLHYIDFERLEVGPLQYELSDKMAGHLLAAPDVPAQHAVEFSHRMRAVVDTVAAPRALTERVLNDVAPIAHLTLGSVALTAWRAIKPFEHCAALNFSYSGQRVTGKKSSEVLLLSGSETLRIQRQPAAEKALRQALLKSGFKRVTGQGGALPGVTGEFFDQVGDEAWIAFVQTGLERLRESGWQIEIKPGFHFDFHEVEQWYADIEEGPEHAWFDLELGIEVNGQRSAL